MRILSQLPRQDFGMYITRPETVYVERDKGESLAKIYEAGFLPYSGAKNLHNIFYSARSARVVLPHFALTSENRRIAKRFDGKFTSTRTPLKDFVPGEAWYDFCLAYFAKKHGERGMPRARLETVLGSGLVSHIISYHKEGHPVGYVLEVEEGSMAHYWYSFYDMELVRQSLGLWLMLDALRQASARGLTYYYLGTVYGEKALYKTNFEPLEWWDGSVWNRNVKELRERSRTH